MKIGRKLILGFLAVVVLTVILGIVNIVSIRDIGILTMTHHTLHMPIENALVHIRIDIEEIIRATEEYDADWMTEEESLEKIKEEKEHVESDFEQLFAASGLLTLEEVEDIKGSVNEFYDLSAELFLLHGTTRAERTPKMEEFDEKVEEIDVELDVLLEKVNKASKASVDSILGMITSRSIINISVLAVVILVALGVAFAISRSISHPIAKLRNTAIAIGKGDLTRRAEVTSKDEIGELSSAFNLMTDEIQKRNEELETVNEELRGANEKLQASEEEIRAANEELQATEEELRASNEELQASNEELREAQGQLIRSERLAAIGQLAGGVGHELRNPLGAIKNAAYYIKGKLAKSELAEKEPRVLEFLDIVDDEINTSNKIINDLLGFSRLGKPAVTPTLVKKVVEEAVARAPIPENIELTTNLDSDSTEIAVDAGQIQQVLINVITNAVQAMPEGGKLTISTRERKRFLELDVTDTGSGITNETKGKIFEPLFTTKAKGIGLGLAVSKSIIDRHGGQIEAKSTEGKGTTFTIKLLLETPVQEDSVEKQ
jgi:signal transduction histidine kinase